MTARFYFTDDAMFLDPEYIPTLAQSAVETGEKLMPTLLSRLPVKNKVLTSSKKHLVVLAGTTGELHDFCTELSAENVVAIGIGQGHDPLVTWCARAVVDHPGKKLERTTTITLVLIGVEGFFVAAGAARNPRRLGTRSRTIRRRQGWAGSCLST